MSGMVTTGNTNISTYGGRTVAIEVTGVCRQDVMRSSNYTVKVPYSRMSQAIKNINRIGGTVAGVSMGGTAAVEPPSEPQSEEAPKRSTKKKNRNRN